MREKANMKVQGEREGWDGFWGRTGLGTGGTRGAARGIFGAVVVAGMVWGSVAWGGGAERAQELVGVLKREPGNQGAMAELAEILMGAGRWESAERVLSRGGDGTEMRALRAECSARRAEGREGLEGALEMAREVGEAGALAESVALLRLGEPEEALAAARRAAEGLVEGGEGASEVRAGRVADQLEECGRVARLFELVE